VVRDRTTVSQRLCGDGSHSERKILADAGDVTCVEDLALSGWFGAHRVSDVVRDDVLSWWRWVIRW
jgi:hypothetical protein